MWATNTIKCEKVSYHLNFFLKKKELDLLGLQVQLSKALTWM